MPVTADTTIIAQALATGRALARLLTQGHPDKEMARSLLQDSEEALQALKRIERKP